MHLPLQQFHARRFDIGVGAADIDHGRDPQHAAHTGVDDAPFIVGHADARRDGVVGGQRHAQAVPLQRIQGHVLPQRLEQGARTDAGSQHDGIRADVPVARVHGDDAPAFTLQAGHRIGHGAFHVAQRLQTVEQGFGELAAVARFFAGGVDGAGQLVAHGGQRRLHRQRLRGVQHLLVRAMPRLVRHQRARLVQQGRAAIGDQLAVFQMAEIQVFLFQQRVHDVAAQVGQAQQLRGGRLGDRRAARQGKLQAPTPLMGIQPGPKAQRGILAQQPAGHAGQHARAGQRGHIAIAELAAVGVAGHFRRTRLAVHQHHVVALARQEIGGRHTDHARTDYANAHAFIQENRERLHSGARAGRPANAKRRSIHNKTSCPGFQFRRRGAV
ncbi:hypothetical protein D3C71_1346610 [compost metagenome]